MLLQVELMTTKCLQSVRELQSYMYVELVIVGWLVGWLDGLINACFTCNLH